MVHSASGSEGVSAVVITGLYRLGGGAKKRVPTAEAATDADLDSDSESESGGEKLSEASGSSGEDWSGAEG